jgi:glycine cleavage system H protein
MPQADDCLYTKDHEWIHREGDDVVLIGITDFAQQELGDIVFASMGETGRSISEGDVIGEIESVKAVAEVYAPLSGEVTEINSGLADHPEVINSDPLGEGWLVKLKVADPGQLDKLMSLEDYQKFLSEEGH